MREMELLMREAEFMHKLIFEQLRTLMWLDLAAIGFTAAFLRDILADTRYGVTLVLAVLCFSTSLIVAVWAMHVLYDKMSDFAVGEESTQHRFEHFADPMYAMWPFIFGVGLVTVFVVTWAVNASRGAQ